MGRKLTCLELFAGAGGQAYALKHSGAVKSVAYCEIDASSQEILRDNMSAGRLDKGPIFDDVKKLTPKVLKDAGVPRLDLIAGGFPCQDVSLAGRRQGIGGGARSKLVVHFLRLVRNLRPSYVFFENVPPVAKDPELHRFMRHLHKWGYDMYYDFFAASDLGAIHKRNRWFMLCVRRDRPAPMRPRFSSRLAGLFSQNAPLLERRDAKIGKLAARAMGNAVVPAVALKAFVELHRKSTESLDEDDRVERAAWHPGRGTQIVDGRLYQSTTPGSHAGGTCHAEEFEVHPPKAPAVHQMTLPSLVGTQISKCAPTPRTGVNSVVAGPTMSSRTIRDLGSFLMFSRKFRRHGKSTKNSNHVATHMVHHQYLSQMMGFPRRWLTRTVRSLGTS